MHNLIIDHKHNIYYKKLNINNITNEYISWINNSKTNQYLDTKSTNYIELKKYIENCYIKNEHLYGIFINNKIHIGNIKLYHLFNNKSFELGILIGDKDYIGKGYGTKIIKFITSFYFKNYNIDYITLGVYKNNIGAVKCYKKCNFIIYEEKDNIYRMKLFKSIS